MKAALADFHGFFKDTSFVEKLFKRTKELLNNVPAQHRLNAIQTENNFLQARQTSSLQATAMTAYNNLVQQNTYQHNPASVQPTPSSSDDTLFKNLDLVESCIESPEQSALQQFETMVQQKQITGEPEQCLDLYLQHLNELEKDIKEKRAATKALATNWGKRKAVLQQQQQQATTPNPMAMFNAMFPNTGMPYQQPVVPLAEVMNFMMQLMGPMQMQQQVGATPVPQPTVVATPVPKSKGNNAKNARPWENDPQWEDAGMDESDDDDEKTDESDE